MPKHPVIAGTLEQYMTWLRETGRDRNGYFYISNVDQLEGFDVNTVLLAPGYMGNPAYQIAVMRGLV